MYVCVWLFMNYVCLPGYNQLSIFVDSVIATLFVQIKIQITMTQAGLYTFSLSLSTSPSPSSTSPSPLASSSLSLSFTPAYVPSPHFSSVLLRRSSQPSFCSIYKLLSVLVNLYVNELSFLYWFDVSFLIDSPHREWPWRLGPVPSSPVHRFTPGSKVKNYSPVFWVLHSEGRYITDIRMQTTK